MWQVVELEGDMLAVLWLTLHSCSLYTRLALPLDARPTPADFGPFL